MTTMKTVAAGVLAASMSAVVSGAAGAATLGLTTSTPTLEASFAIVDYLEFGPDGDLSTFGAEVDFTDGVFPTGFTEIGFGVGFSLADPESDASGGFDVFDEDGLFLDGDLMAVGFTEDMIELKFGDLGGSAASLFGSSVLALIAFDDPLGANPFAALTDGDAYVASISLSKVVAPIPLPAGLPLIATGLGGLALLRRRQTRQ